MLRATLSESEIRKAIGLPEQGDRTVTRVAQLGASEDDCLYFVNKRLTTSDRQTLSLRQGCIVIVKTGSELMANLGDCVVLEAKDPRAAIAKVLALIVEEKKQKTWLSERKVEEGVIISPLAVVDEFVEIGAGTVIEPFCVVRSDVKLGRGVILRSGVKIHSRVTIGDHTIIGDNSVVGQPGFGFVRDDQGNKTRIPHLGGVIIGSHVDIGSVATIQSGTIAPTTIEDRAKIDDHVQVGHNARVGRSASLTTAVVICGSAVVGEEAWVGVNSSIRNGRRVGSRSLVGMHSAVQKDMDDASVTRVRKQRIRTRPADFDLEKIGF